MSRPASKSHIVHPVQTFNRLFIFMVVILLFLSGTLHAVSAPRSIASSIRVNIPPAYTAKISDATRKNSDFQISNLLTSCTLFSTAIMMLTFGGFVVIKAKEGSGQQAMGSGR